MKMPKLTKGQERIGKEFRNAMDCEFIMSHYGDEEGLHIISRTCFPLEWWVKTAIKKMYFYEDYKNIYLKEE